MRNSDPSKIVLGLLPKVRSANESGSSQPTVWHHFLPESVFSYSHFFSIQISCKLIARAIAWERFVTFSLA